MNVRQAVESFPFRHRPSEKILVACSGGADSVALLLALHEAQYSLVAGHINHGTRSTESDADEEFVRQACLRLNIPFTCKKLELPPASNEDTMRTARYTALFALAKERGCGQIATGHTADDVLETLLLHQLRGATVLGWSGIPPLRSLDGVLLVRPLLHVARTAVRDYLTERGWSWREDASNHTPHYLRNRVRHELLPKMIELCGGDGSRLALQAARSAEVLREEFALLHTLATQQLAQLTVRHETDLLILDGIKFSQISVAMQRRVLRLAPIVLHHENIEMGFERIEEVRLHILSHRRRAVWQWSKSLRVEWTGEHSGNRIRFMRVMATN